MSFFSNWRHRRRLKKFADLRRDARAALPPPQTNAQKLIADIEHNTLLRMKAESEIKIAELAATAEDRKEQRDYDRKEKEKDRTRREQQAAFAREFRKKKKLGAAGENGDIPAFMKTCEDCRAKLEGRDPAHNRDMVSHAARGHIAALEKVMERIRHASASN